MLIRIEFKIGPFDIFMELLIPHGDPFGMPQVMLISVLGMRTIRHLCDRLDERIRLRNQGVSRLPARTAGLSAEGEEQGDREEARADPEDEDKADVKYFYRLMLFLCICFKSVSPNTISILEEMRLGERLSRFIDELDPRLVYKNLHFALAKTFIMLSESISLRMRALVVDCDFAMKLYLKYKRRRNLIHSQFAYQFQEMGKTWSINTVNFVKRNLEIVDKLKETDQDIRMMLTNVYDKNGNFIESRMDAKYPDPLNSSVSSGLLKFDDMGDFYQLGYDMDGVKDKEEGGVLSGSFEDFEMKFLEGDELDGGIHGDLNLLRMKGDGDGKGGVDSDLNESIERLEGRADGEVSGGGVVGVGGVLAEVLPAGEGGDEADGGVPSPVVQRKVLGGETENGGLVHSKITSAAPVVSEAPVNSPGGKKSPVIKLGAVGNERFPETQKFDLGEEDEAKETLKGLLASLRRKKKKRAEDEADQASKFISDDGGYMAPLQPMRKLPFTLMDEDDDDGLLNIPQMNSLAMQRSQNRREPLKLNINLGKRVAPNENTGGVGTDNGDSDVVRSGLDPTKILKI